MAKNFQTDSSDCCRYFPFTLQEVKHRSPISRSLTRPQGKGYSGPKSVDLGGHMLNRIFQSMNWKSFHPKENRQGVNCEEKFHPAGKQHSVGIVASDRT